MTARQAGPPAQTATLGFSITVTAAPAVGAYSRATFDVREAKAGTPDDPGVTVTVRAYNVHQQALRTGGDTVTVTTNSDTAIVSAVTDHGDGTYTAKITDTKTARGRTVNVQAHVNGILLSQSRSVRFDPGPASPLGSTVEVYPERVLADGETTALVTVLTRDAYGNRVFDKGNTVEVTAGDNVDVSEVTDHGVGVYTANIKSTVAEEVTVTASLDGTDLTHTANATFIADDADDLTVTADSPVVAGSPLTVTVTIEDEYGNGVSGETVTLEVTGSAEVAGARPRSGRTTRLPSRPP